MNDMISGIAGQLFQQSIDNQAVKQTQPEASGKKSFENFLQQDKTIKANEAAPQTGVEKAQNPQSPATSGNEMMKKLEQFRADLEGKYRQTNQSPSDFQKMMPELVDGKSRFGLLKEAYSEIGNTSKVTNDLSGRFTQVESEYKEVESIMKSDKNLSTGELLALQARLYQVSQHIEVMSKVVDQMAGGIKTVLNTNI